jgi:hypothetical protein
MQCDLPRVRQCGIDTAEVITARRALRLFAHRRIASGDYPVPPAVVPLIKLMLKHGVMPGNSIQFK